MKNTLSEQIKKLQQQNGLPTYVKRERDFPFVTEGGNRKRSYHLYPFINRGGVNRERWVSEFR